MTRKTFNLAEGVYTAPLCTISDICPEGILCSSIDEFDKEFEFNPWATNQE
jgi:hypothetical protein